MSTCSNLIDISSLPKGTGPYRKLKLPKKSCFQPQNSGITAKGKRPQKAGLTAKGERRRFVEHKYSDHAHEEDELAKMYGKSLVERYKLPPLRLMVKKSAHVRDKIHPPPFPLKLHMNLNET